MKPKYGCTKIDCANIGGACNGCEIYYTDSLIVHTNYVAKINFNYERVIYVQEIFDEIRKKYNI